MRSTALQWLVRCVCAYVSRLSVVKALIGAFLTEKRDRVKPVQMGGFAHPDHLLLPSEWCVGYRQEQFCIDIGKEWNQASAHSLCPGSLGYGSGFSLKHPFSLTLFSFLWKQSLTLRRKNS